jgi:phosphohistidine phosphatase
MLGLQEKQASLLDETKSHVFLMRHFTAQHSQFGIHDRDRTLTDQSIEELDVIKNNCSSFLENVTLVICSNTKRTRQTLEGVQPLLSSRVQIQFQDSLYCASLDQILDFARSTDLNHKYILVIGHNPGLGCFLQEVQKENFNTHFSWSKSFPIGGMAIFENNSTSWIETKFSSLKLTHLFHLGLKNS